MVRFRLGTRLWLNIAIEQERETWSAFCDELHLASVGGTHDEASRNLMIAIHAYAGVMNRRGVLEQFLTEREIQHEEIWTKIDPLPAKVPVDILNWPIELLGLPPVSSERY